MINPHSHPVSVLILLLVVVLAIPVSADVFDPVLWDRAGTCVCDLGAEYGVLVDCDRRRVSRVAERKGLETAGLKASFEDLRVAARRIIQAGIVDVKAHPDFLTNDRVVRAAAKAEACIDAAREALRGRRPFVKSYAAYRSAYAALLEFL